MWTIAPLVFFFISFIQPSKQQVDFSKCETEKSCLRVPEGCSECSMFVTVAVDSNDKNYINLELGGKVAAGRYVAVGFSKDDEMGKDAVTACIDYNGAQDVALSFNPGKSNKVVSKPPNVIKLIRKSYSNGILYCNFKQQIVPSNDMNGEIYNLASQKFYLLLATGVSSDITSVRKHSDKLVGPQSNLTKVTKLTTPPMSLNAKLVRAHGVLMIFGWWVMITTGILFARHFKDMWPSKEPFGAKLWFQLHRGLNGFGITCVLVAFIIIFVEANGWVGNEPSHRNHAICGLVTVILGLLQPLNALARCHPGTKKRPIFNLIHRGFGIWAWVLSGATVWFASNFYTNLSPAGKFGDRPRAAMIYFWGTVLCAEIILTTTADWFKLYTVKSEATVLPEIHGSAGSAADKPVTTEIVNIVAYKPWFAHVRLGILALYLVIVLSVFIQLAVFICEK